MKTHQIFFAIVATLLHLLIFASCNPTKLVESKEIGLKADDAAAKAEFERANDDIEFVLRSSSYENNGRVENGNNVILPCGRVTLNQSNFTIQYESQNCLRKVLSGSIEVKLVKGNSFSEKDAQLEIEFKDYKVFYGATQSSITYTGKQYLTNQSGGRLADLFTNKPDTVVHKLRAIGMTLKFDSATTTTKSRDWNVARLKTFISNGTAAGITFEAAGDTAFTFDGVAEQKITEWGKNKENRDFINIIDTPFKWENCGAGYAGPYVLKVGKLVHKSFSTASFGVFRGTFTAEAGHKLSGTNPVRLNDCESDGYKLDWALTLNNNSVWSLSNQFQPY